MGLGLYIAKQIVMKFDGNIDFFSKELQGSVFVFSFKVDSSEYSNDNLLESMASGVGFPLSENNMAVG